MHDHLPVNEGEIGGGPHGAQVRFSFTGFQRCAGQLTVGELDTVTLSGSNGRLQIVVTYLVA
jgi:hypothetical protein